jgi:Protein of unknown function (DUF1501)
LPDPDLARVGPTTVYIEMKYGSELSATTSRNQGQPGFPSDQLSRNARVGLLECGYFQLPGLFQGKRRDYLLLVIWMGEFGRTPRINARGAQPGRDHYPRAWSSVMVGGGIRGGQVIGRTDAEAATVVDRPVGTFDFMATVCRALGIDYNKQNIAANGRPIRIVDRPATPIAQLFA